MLGDTRRLRLDEEGARTAPRRARRATLGVGVDPDAHAVDLALGHQQQVEIIKALWRGSRVLILDEPTSMLTPQGVAELTKVLERLKEQGQAVIFITHKLHEALSLGDYISILRQGRLAGTIDRRALREKDHEELRAEIVRIMFERGGARGGRRRRAPRRPVRSRGDQRDCRRGRRRSRAAGRERPGRGAELGIEDVSLELREGEILGVAGVDGNGQRALAEVIAGQRGASHGDVLLFGGRVTGMTGVARQKLGLRYVTDDRLGEGIVGSLPVGINLFLKRIGAAAVLEARADPARGDRSARGRARAGVRRADHRPGNPRRHALGRQHPEDPAGARAELRSEGGRLQQADLRTRREDDRDRARPDPPPGRAGRALRS